MSRDVANGLADTGIPHAVSADGRALRDAYRRQAEVLVDAGVDVIALEMMGARTHAQPAVAAAADLNIPVWLGISVAAAGRDGAETIDGEDVSELVSELPMDAIDAVFVMHSDIGLVTDSLRVIRAIWDGTVGAYPTSASGPPNWVFQEITPARFADQAGEWVSNGATIVGGCCGIGPEHIRELTNALT
jgi:homocysteine S-methyltransferase